MIYMEMMIKCLYLSLILFLIAWLATAEEITTENLLPNGTNNASSYQSVDNTVPNVTTNGFNVEGNITDWGQELETTGTGSINYTGNLTDHATQEQLNNGVTLDSTTIVQNCEYQGSNWQCGQAQPGQDTFTTTVKILDNEGNTLAIVNQIRNTDAGYGDNAYKYEDTVTYTGTGSNQFYWEWEGVDLGYDTYGTSLGGPNLLGAKLTMTYDDTVLPEENREIIEEVIEEFEEWGFEEPTIIEEFEYVPVPVAIEELGFILEEEEFMEVLETAQELEEEFIEEEILQVFGGPEIVEEPQEEVTTEETVTETVAATEEFMEEQPEQSQSAKVETIQEESKSESQGPSEQQVDVVDEKEKPSITVQDVQTQVAAKIKDVNLQLAVVNQVVQQAMSNTQADIQTYTERTYTDVRPIYVGNDYQDLRTLDEYNKQIYTDVSGHQAMFANDPLYKYQQRMRGR